MNKKQLKTAAQDNQLIDAVLAVLTAKVQVETLRSTVLECHKAVINAGTYIYEEKGRGTDSEGNAAVVVKSTRPFTYEDHVKGQGYCMKHDQWNSYYEAVDDMYRTYPRLAAMLEGKEAGFCPLLIAENVESKALRAMLDRFKAVTGAFNTDDLLCSRNGLDNLRKGEDLIIGMVVTANSDFFEAVAELTSTVAEILKGKK